MLTTADGSPPPARAKGRRWLVPVAVSAVIFVWQFNFNSVSPESRLPYAMTASMGMCSDAPLFFYFFHHYGLFPVGALDVPRLGRSKQAAAEFVAQHGDRLEMDFGWPTNTPRFGDYGKLFLFYPDLLLRGDPTQPSVLPFNQFLFIIALLAVFWAFWLEGYGLLGGLIVVLVGSNPFQIYETYGRANIFSIPISVALIALAVHLRLLTRRKGIDGLAWVIAIVSAAVLATFREVRAEASVVAVSAIATYLVARAPLVQRLLVVAAFVAVSMLTGYAWTKYWDRQFAQAEQFVARAGGNVFRPQGDQHHAVWHAMFCGLGDFGADRGFSWDDRDAFQWATMRSATNPNPIPFHYAGGYYFTETFDGRHHVAPTDSPEYNQLVRARVLSEIRRDPLWYGGILFNRWLAIQRDATPAALSLGSMTLAVPGTGWLTLPVLLFALWRRKFFHATVILFVLSLSAVALLVYSGKGMTYYGIAHLVALAVAVDLVVRSMSRSPGGPKPDVR